MTNIVPLFPDPDAAARARDEAFDRVTAGQALFLSQAWFFVEFMLPSGWTGIVEDIRVRYTNAGYPQPRSTSCWGPLTKNLRKAGLLIEINWDLTKLEQAHGRRAVEYRLWR